MSMNGDIEVVAAAAFREAGFSPLERAPSVLLAQRLLGPTAVRELPESVLAGTGALIRVGSEWRIYVRKESPAVVKRFTVLHELSHYLLGRAASEFDCDRLAAALLLPLAAVFSKPLLARSVPRVARSYGASETCVWRRFGEVTASPVAVVTPTTVHVSGKAYAWPSEQSMRELAAMPRPRPGLRRCALSDADARVALAAS